MRRAAASAHWKIGRAWRPRRAHLFASTMFRPCQIGFAVVWCRYSSFRVAEWRCCWEETEKTKNSLQLREATPGRVRREKVKSVVAVLCRDKLGGARPNVLFHHRGAVFSRALLRETFRSRSCFLELPLPATNPSFAMMPAFLQRYLKQTGPPKHRLLRPIVEWRSGCLRGFSGSVCSWELFHVE